MKKHLILFGMAVALFVNGCATWEKGVSAIAPMVTPEDQQLFCQGVSQLLAGEPAVDLETLLRERPDSAWATQARKILAMSDEIKRLEAMNSSLNAELKSSRTQLDESRKKQATQTILLKRQKQYIQKLKDLIVDSEIQQIK